MNRAPFFILFFIPRKKGTRQSKKSSQSVKWNFFVAHSQGSFHLHKGECVKEVDFQSNGICHIENLKRKRVSGSHTTLTMRSFVLCSASLITLANNPLASLALAFCESPAKPFWVAGTGRDKPTAWTVGPSLYL